MKLLNIILMLTITQFSFASSFQEEQSDELKRSHVPTLYYATPEINKGVYKLKRTAETPEKKVITIIKQSSDTYTDRSAVFGEVNGSTQFLGMRTNGTFAKKTRFEIELDFSEADTLDADEIEEITLLLNFDDDDIEVRDVSIATDNTDRDYQVKDDLTNWFGFNKEDAKVQFVLQE